MEVFAYPGNQEPIRDCYVRQAPEGMPHLLISERVTSRLPVWTNCVRHPVICSDASSPKPNCYYPHMFNFGKPKTAGDWIVHVIGAIIALFLIWWLLHFILGI